MELLLRYKLNDIQYPFKNVLSVYKTFWKRCKASCSFMPLQKVKAERKQTISCACHAVMPKVRTSDIKFPEGWELIEPTLRDLNTKMREGE